MYLESHPLIKYSQFKNKSNKLYYKNNCNFYINENAFKII